MPDTKAPLPETGFRCLCDGLCDGLRDALAPSRNEPSG